MYTTKTEIENYLLTTIDATFDSQITTWISAAQEWIENYTDREFEANTQTNKYDGKGEHSLLIDDVMSVDTVWFTENDATGDAQTETLATTDYYLYQNNNPNKTPYNKMVINPDGDQNVFEWGLQNIWIKGSFGYSTTVPADIKMVTTKLVASMVKPGKDGEIADYTEADLSVTYRAFDDIMDRDVGVKSVLDWYKKKDRITGFNVKRG